MSELKIKYTDLEKNKLNLNINLNDKKYDIFYGVIYVITNLIDNKKYIGQTIDKKCRWNGTLKGAYYCCYNQHLINSIKKYDVKNFKSEILIRTYNKKDLDFFEDYYIIIYDTMNPKKGYNWKGGGAYGKHIDKTKKKCRDVMLKKKQEKGYINSPETREKMRGKRGTYRTNTNKKPKYLSDEHKKKIGDAHRGVKRKPFSEETKQKMRKPKSEEHKQNVIDAIKELPEIFCQYCNKKYKFLKRLEKHIKICPKNEKI